MLPVIGMEWFTDNIRVGLEYEGGELICQEAMIVVMQSTYMKDNDGIEIYDGDILKLGREDDFGHRFYVEYLKGCFLLCWKQRNAVRPDGLSIIHRDRMLGDFVPHELKVVGNIYTTPELLA